MTGPTARVAGNGPPTSLGEVGPSGRERAGRGQGLVALGFLAPALVCLVVLRLLPTVLAAKDSLYQESLLLGGRVWVGSENYANLLGSPDFRKSLIVTMVFTLVINPLQVAVSFLLAVLYTRRAAGSRLWRSLVILPVAAPAAVSAVIWGVVYRPDRLGNAFLARLGLPDQPFLTSQTQALPSIIVLLSWVGVGYWMLFLIAGINDVPAELGEAASLDGASAWRQLWSITLPLCRRPIAFVLVAATVANLLVFAPVQILTKGGPDGSTNLVMYDIYSRAYTIGDVNTAQAQVVLLVALTVLIVGVQFKMLGDEQS